ncbi:F5A9.12 [Arabidopsis thaliana]|uniref:F5A9.12 n=1 Tax=Arabidopsis thaliana TaxID=3702 RepID=Q9FXK4_ARATH|nr:F5A9.12 [Arabidopsis thaliana]
MSTSSKCLHSITQSSDTQRKIARLYIPEPILALIVSHVSEEGIEALKNWIKSGHEGKSAAFSVETLSRVRLDKSPDFINMSSPDSVHFSFYSKCLAKRNPYAMYLQSLRLGGIPRGHLETKSSSSALPSQPARQLTRLKHLVSSSARQSQAARQLTRPKRIFRVILVRKLPTRVYLEGLNPTEKMVPEMSTLFIGKKPVQEITIINDDGGVAGFGAGDGLGAVAMWRYSKLGFLLGHCGTRLSHLYKPVFDRQFKMLKIHMMEDMIKDGEEKSLDTFVISRQLTTFTDLTGWAFGSSVIVEFKVRLEHLRGKSIPIA